LVNKANKLTKKLITTPRSLYLHIPFCKRKCFYCDFAITTGGSDLQEVYVTALCQEIQLTANQVGSSRLKTVFFGGGTPSLLSVAQIGRILQTVAQYFGIESNAEISLEANPGTVTEQSLKGYQAIGINRVSLGAQAFQDHLLDACGRGHSVAEIYSAVTAIKNAGISNFGIDLISGLPHQAIADCSSIGLVSKLNCLSNIYYGYGRLGLGGKIIARRHSQLLQKP